MTAAGFLVMSFVAVVAFCWGCAWIERHPTEPLDRDDDNLLDVAPRTYVGGWLPNWRRHDPRMQSQCRPPAVVALPRRTRRTR